MGRIVVTSLNANVADALEKNKYSEEQVQKMYASLKADKDKKKMPLLIVMIFVAVLFIGMSIPFLIDIGFPDAMGVLIAILCIVAIIAFLSWLFTIGNITMKWNKLIKEYYPSIYKECKL